MQSWKDKFVAELDEAISELNIAKQRYQNGKSKTDINAALNVAKTHINKSKEYIAS